MVARLSTTSILEYWNDHSRFPFRWKGSITETTIKQVARLQAIPLAQNLKRPGGMSSKPGAFLTLRADNTLNTSYGVVEREVKELSFVGSVCVSVSMFSSPGRTVCLVKNYFSNSAFWRGESTTDESEGLTRTMSSCRISQK